MGDDRTPAQARDDRSHYLVMEDLRPVLDEKAWNDLYRFCIERGWRLVSITDLKARGEA